MNNLNDKVWFVYLGDHHEGPFSVEEVKGKMNEGQVSTTSYVWKEGMADWKTMSDVPELFEHVQSPPEPPVPPAQAPEMPPEVTQAEQNPVEAQPSEMVSATSGEEQSVSQETATMAEAVTTEAAPIATEAKSEEVVAADVQLEEHVDLPDLVVPAEATPIAKLDVQTQTQTNTSVETEAHPSEVRAEQNSKNGFFSRLFSRKSRTTEVGQGGLVVGEEERPPFYKSRVFVLLLVVVAASVAGYQTGYLQKSPLGPIVEQAAGQISIRPVLQKIVSLAPFLGQWISPLPELKDVSEKNHRELEAAAVANLGDGIKVAVVSSEKESGDPILYLTSNLADGAKFEVFIRGKVGTLLNQLEYEARGSVELQKRFARIQNLRSKEGKLPPRGQYMVYVYESDEQPPNVQETLNQKIGAGITLPAPMPRGRKAVVMKTLFLGGPKDRNYFTRLNRFHKKLQGRAKKELDELKNFSSTLVSQYKSHASKFQTLKRGRKTRSKRRQWSSFSAKWKKLDQQILTQTQKWTPEMLSKGYYYGPLYEDTKIAAQSLSDLHAYQSKYFGRGRLPRDYSAQENDKIRKAKEAINRMRGRIDQTEKLPLTENGMPQRVAETASIR